MGKSFAGRCVVDCVDLVVHAGEAVCLVGSSGVGKTTVLEMAAGTLAPDRGAVRRKAESALMFQDDALVPWLTAEGNIAYILGNSQMRAALWLTRFGLEAGQYPAAMSGGMRRRLSLARTFAAGRRLIVLDEPFAFLDESWQEKVAAAIAERVLANDAVLLASHTVKPLSLPCFASVPCRLIPLSGTPVVIRDGFL